MKIAVGMSGGVDSSVSALLLKKAGHDVIGITMILKPNMTEQEEKNMYNEANDAKAVCEKIGIPHYVKDFREEFSKNVLSNFINEYKNARTPNPCIVCNRTMKFGAMLDFAKSLGCDKLATGHYAEILEKNGRFFLKKSDSPKDQSYFLYGLSEEQLSCTYFPLISREKAETREIAREHNLPVANKSDSQDICFVKNGDYVSFIEAYANEKAKVGNFVDENGKILGQHKGIYCYTVGQRKGLGIALGERRFVSKIDALANTVCLSSKDSGQCTEILVENPHFINIQAPTTEMSVFVKTRFRAKPCEATIVMQGDDLKIKFKDIQNFVCPGQSAVFYSDDIVLGGGIIKEILNGN